jgi:hypothetical protein
VGGDPVHHWYTRTTTTRSAIAFRMIFFFDRRAIGYERNLPGVISL